ncbi:hypothetical protein AQUCO_04500033v1 [Aquilegia coerulea]|uniref:DUF724 domain-containing protein n=1 Tax=Aquilegia coerulea TaxID=218851 RepID=A0A2G5CLJ8_AQUCA|nr:hypothetical protein AQUCO_04500033v1 [Aquilegia coerulea]
MGSTGFSFGFSSSPSFFSNSSSSSSPSYVPPFSYPSFSSPTPTTPETTTSVGVTTTTVVPFTFSTTSTINPSQPPQASVQINEEIDINQELSKPDEEQSQAKLPSKQQTKPMGKSQSVKKELQLKASETKSMGKSQSMKNELQLKAGESNDTDMVTELVNESGSDSLNNGFKFSLGELPNGGGNIDAKDKSISFATEGIKKSERFGHTRILRGITQNPHYTPLQCYSKRAREKLIVGWDELFEETIDQIQSLTTETFSSNVGELWKTMAELENLGYNVARLKKRMDDLTDVINRRNTSQTEISDLRTKAEDYKEQKKKIEKEIADLQAQADNTQIMVNELTDQVDKMEGNLPVVDALFESVAVKSL